MPRWEWHSSRGNIAMSEGIPLGQALETNTVVECILKYPKEDQRTIITAVKLGNCSGDIIRLMLLIFAQNQQYVIDEVQKMFGVAIGGSRVWGVDDLERGTFFCHYIAEKLVENSDGSFSIPLVPTQQHYTPKPEKKAS